MRKSDFFVYYSVLGISGFHDNKDSTDMFQLDISTRGETLDKFPEGSTEVGHDFLK